MRRQARRSGVFLNKKLRVKAKPGVLVMCPVAMAANVHRYVGMRPKTEPVSDPSCRADLYEVMEEGVEYDEDRHIKEAVKRGELEALDEWTAKRCGLKNWKPAEPKKSDKK